MCVYEKVGLSNSSIATTLAATLAGRSVGSSLATSPLPLSAGEDESLSFLEQHLAALLSKSSTRKYDLLRSVVPSAVFDTVFQDNVQLLVDQSVFSVEFFSFMKNLVGGIEVGALVVVPVSKWLPDVGCVLPTLQKSLADGLVLDTELLDSVVALVTNFLIDTLSRAEV